MHKATERPAWSGRRDLVKTLVIVVVAMGFAISVASVGFSAPRETVLLQLRVAIEQPTARTGIRLHVQLINISQEVVAINELDLPWIDPNVLEFLERAYRRDAPQRELPQKGPMVDYFGRTINIQAGHSLEGTLNLVSYFSGIEEAILQSDVVVEWNCRSLSVRFICEEGERGKILIPKR